VIETDHLEDLGVNGRIILKRILQEIGWIHLAQGRNTWSVPVKYVMNLPVA
jgi:hypothetical protein